MNTKANLCKQCGFLNKAGTAYCQNCGGKLLYKETVREYLASLNFNGLAGAGRKDINFAPLATPNLLPQEGKAAIRHSGVSAVPRTDGSWFCPDCGYKNQQGETYCFKCSRHI